MKKTTTLLAAILTSYLGFSQIYESKKVIENSRKVTQFHKVEIKPDYINFDGEDFEIKGSKSLSGTFNCTIYKCDKGTSFNFAIIRGKVYQITVSQDYNEIKKTTLIFKPTLK